MATIGITGPLNGAAAGHTRTGVFPQTARRSERGLRLRLGWLHVEFRRRRETPETTNVAISPEFSDRELVRLAQRSRITYGASWERSLAAQYGAIGNLPR